MTERSHIASIPRSPSSSSHVLMLSARTLPGPFGVLSDGGSAVYVFMILSGFVITHLLLEKRESYVPWLVRRFFRLFPVYFVCLIFSILILEWRDYFSGHVAWSQSLARMRTSSETQFFWQHLIAHLTMLHGLLPDQVLYHSSNALLGTAWSISLEWQFYILAPLAVWLLLSWRGQVLVVFSVIGIYAYEHGYLGRYGAPSSLLAMSGYFIVGITSRLALLSGSMFGRMPAFFLCMAILMIVLSANDADALIVWAVSFGLVAFRENFAVIRGLLTNSASRFLGRISYPIYLVHLPLFFTTAYIAVRYWPHISQMRMLVLLLLTSALAILAAYVLHRVVEKPGMILGTEIATFLAGPAPRTRPAGATH
jgi:peptidoglycan/LPS O-acetylase OafA/YrhL